MLRLLPRAATCGIFLSKNKGKRVDTFGATLSSIYAVSIMGKRHYNKRARLDGGSGSLTPIPQDKKHAIIEGRKSKDAKKIAQALEAIFADESLELPSGLATIALSVVEDANEADYNALRPTLRQAYEKCKSPSCNEAFYSTAVRAFLVLDSVDRALEIVKEMREAKHVPKHRTLSPILAAACRTSETLGVAKQVYDEMAASQKIDMVNEDDVANILEACARFHSVAPSSSSSASASNLPNSVDTAKWVEDVLRDCVRRFTDVPSIRLVQSAKDFFQARNDGKEIPSAQPLDDQHRCKSCGSVMLSVEPDDAQMQIVLKQTEELVPVQNPKKKEEWEKFLSWEKRNLSKFDTIVDGANISYFRGSPNGGPEPRYEQADLVMKVLREMGRKPLLFFHARHFTRHGIPRDLEQRWRTEQSIFVVPHGHNDDVFWLHMSLMLGPRSWLVTNDQMRDHRFEMIQSYYAFGRWKERHHVSYEVLYSDRDKTLSARVFPPLKYSVQIQKSGTTNKWHIPIQLPLSDKEKAVQEEISNLRTMTPQELRTKLLKGDIDFETYREVRRESLGCEVPKAYNHRYEWLCL